MNDPLFTPLSFKEKRKRLIQYLLAKVTETDWHGVSDAANDLRVLEAEERVSHGRCCENGFFGQEHHCRKQSGNLDNV